MIRWWDVLRQISLRFEERIILGIKEELIMRIYAIDIKKRVVVDLASHDLLLGQNEGRKLAQRMDMRMLMQPT